MMLELDIHIYEFRGKHTDFAQSYIRLDYDKTSINGNVVNKNMLLIFFMFREVWLTHTED